MNGANINCDTFSMSVGDKDIVIKPSTVKINNSTNVDVSGIVKNYINAPVFDIKAAGSLKTSDLKQLLGSDLAIYIKEKGTLPIAANITGDSKKQTVELSVNANSNNYITPIDITNALNKDTVISAVMDIKDNKLTIRA